MLGDLIRKLFGGEEGVQQVSPRDASQMPQGMNFARQPMSVPQLPEDASQMPSGMRVSEKPQLQTRNFYGRTQGGGDFGFNPQGLETDAPAGDRFNQFNAVSPVDEDQMLSRMAFQKPMRAGGLQSSQRFKPQSLQGSLSDYYRLR